MFDDDNRAESFRDDDICFRRPAIIIDVLGPEDDLIQHIELPELTLTRAECDPEWLAMLDAESTTGARR